MTDLSILKFSLRRLITVLKLENQSKEIKGNMLFPSNTKSLIFNSSETPKVSIIIPFYNQLNYTWNCLEHLNKNLSDTYSYEIILINDYSSEAPDFSTVKGITVINNEKNLGFLRNINKGIKVSKGEFIYLLNNDTEVHKGFLDELFFVFENFRNVGAVGSKLLNANGTLQEAGAIFKTNCDIEIIRTRKKPFFPEVNYIYKVDYCSGCSILFKKHTDKGELNLLDEQFIPAYYEETDLCFTLKHKQNKDLYYTPFSVVLHYDGVSYNSNQNIDSKKNDLRKEHLRNNSEKFEKKWETELKNIKARSIEERIIELYHNKSILFFCDLLPTPDENTESKRFITLLSYKEQGYHIMIIPQKGFYKGAEKNHIEYYQRLGINVFYEHRKFYGFQKYLAKQKSDHSIAWFPNQAIYKSYKGTLEKYLPNAKIILDAND